MTQFVKNSTITLLLLLLFTILASAFHSLANNTTNTAILYILYVVIVARLTSGYFFGIVASIFGVLGVNYLFTYPYLKLDFTITGYPIAFLGMLTTSVIISTLTTHIKEEARSTEQRNAALRKLNEVSKQLISAESYDEIIQLVLRASSNLTHGSAVFYNKDPLEALPIYEQLLHASDIHIITSDTERQNGHTAYTTGQMILPTYTSEKEIQCTHLPIISSNMTWGILVLYDSDDSYKDPVIRSFIGLLLPQIALAFERQELSAAHHELSIISEKEKTRANLLRAVSHDLRTPLTSMIGASNTYLENSETLSTTEKIQLISHIKEDANWLLHMVENLLSVTRIQQDTAKVKKTYEPLEEVLAESISLVKKRIPTAQIQVYAPTDFVLVPMDPTLIEQVIINLLENAIKHSQTTEPIILKAECYTKGNKPSYVEVQVIDHGVGIDRNILPSIFNGVNTPSDESSDTSKGMRIGLSICQTIIKAHNGQITAENSEHGAIFTFRLPLEGDETIE